MITYEIPAVNENSPVFHDVLWPFPAYSANSAPTRFFLSGNENSFSVHMEASFSVPLRYSKRSPKGRVFEDDCLEIFVRPQSSLDSFFPAPFYYGWEINAGGTLLEYRAGIGEEGVRIIGSGNGETVTDGSGAVPGVEPVHGILRDDILGKRITFDYDWKSRATVSSAVDDGKRLWTVDLCIPWSDFGLTEAPHGETWYFTVNRIDISSLPAGGAPGLACLHDGITEPRFHQPDLFPALYIR